MAHSYALAPPPFSGLASSHYSSEPGSIWEWELVGENLSLLQRSGLLASYVKHIRWLFFFESPLLWISGSHCIMREDSIRSEIGTGHGEPSGKPPKNTWSPPRGFKKRENWGQYHMSWWLEEVEILFMRTVVSPCRTLAWRNNCFHGLGH